MQILWCHSARSASASHCGTTTYPEHHSQNGELGLESASKNQAVRRRVARESGRLPEFQSDNSRDNESHNLHISPMLSSLYMKSMEALGNRTHEERYCTEISTPSRGEPPRSSIRRVPDHQSRRRIAKTRYGISTSPTRSPSASGCAARSAGAHAAAGRRIAAACGQSLRDQNGRSTVGPCGIARFRRSATHATKSPLRW